MKDLKNTFEQGFDCKSSSFQSRKVTCMSDYLKIEADAKAWDARLKKQAMMVVKDEVKVEVFNKSGMSHDEIIAAREKVYEAERARLKVLPTEKLLDVQRVFLQNGIGSIWYREELSRAAGLGTLFYESTIKNKRDAERDKRYSLYKNSEIDKHFWEVKNDDVIANKISEGIKTNQVVYLYGKPGVGKTYSSTLFLKKMIDNVRANKSCRCRLTNFSEILSLIRASKSFAYQDQDPIYKMSLYDYLVIDDLGLEKPDQNMLDALFYIVSKRQQNKLPTVLVSNFDMNKIVPRLSALSKSETTIEAIRSRLFGDCCCVEYVGEDRRKAA